MKNKFIAFFTCLCFLLASTQSYAQETDANEETPTLETAVNLNLVTNLQLGQPAPFAGILLSDDVAAKLFADIKFSERECNLRLESELSITNLKYKSELDALQLRLDIEIDRTSKLIDVKNERIQFLEANYKPPAWYEAGEFWMAVGVVSGVLITVGAGYAINQVGNN